MATPEPLVRIEQVTHRLGPAGGRAILHQLDLDIAQGEFVALAGRSGSGKSTLCHLVAGLGVPTSGRIVVDGRPADKIEDWSVVSLLPQRLALVEELSVAGNALLPAALRRRALRRRALRRRALPPTTPLPGPIGVGDDSGAELLEALGLTELRDRLVAQTSLGEQQRTALARALILRPRLAVLDEPTGHQDDDHIARVLAAIALVQAHGSAILVATRDERILAAAGRVVELHDGRIHQEGARPRQGANAVEGGSAHP